MSRWDGIELLAEVVESGSFSSAAKRLNVSKSHVSRHISQLENRLGTQLLHRTTRKISLTETGQAYYQRCREILSSLAEAEQSVMALQSTPRGTLRMTVAGAFGERYIVPAAIQFMQTYPQLRIEVDFSNRNVDLVEEGYDLAIRAGTLSDSSLIARRIANRRLHICGSPEYFARYGKPDSIRGLKHHNCLVGSVQTWRFRERDGHHLDLRIEGNWRSNNGHALLMAARSGLGLTQLPEFYLQDDLESGRLEAVMQEFQPTDTAVWAVYPSNRHLSPKVQQFVDFLASHFRSIDYLI